MKIKDLEAILREYSKESEIIFSASRGRSKYDLQNDGVRHHADSDTICIDFLIK